MPSNMDGAGMPDEYFDCLDRRDLYAKFMNLVENNKIDFVTRDNKNTQNANLNREEDDISLNNWLNQDAHTILLYSINVNIKQYQIFHK